MIWLLEELELNYTINSFSFDDVKKAPFININPNGRVPAIEDPNAGLTFWETGAINTYLIEEYDIAHRLSYTDRNQRHLCSQYLHFQMSGQGPYFGQCGVFSHLWPEKLPAVIKRYADEVKRVLSVLKGVPAAKPADQQWLVGSRMTFADMAFVPWNDRLDQVLGQSWDEVWDGKPHVRAWHEKMVALPSWKRNMEVRARLMDEQGLQWNGVPKGIETFAEYEKKIAAGHDTTAKE